MTSAPATVLAAARAMLASPRFAAAVTLASVGVGILAPVIERLIGVPGLVAMVAGLALLALGTLLVRLRELEWVGILPVSLLAFLGWTGLTIIWSQYQWATLGALAYLLAFTVMGLAIALTRDLIQIVRAFGDVLRFVLGLSLAIEILSGALIDTPIAFLGVQGNLDQLGPLQGVMGSRNQLALISLIALITFGIELTTRSVGRTLGILSIVGATLMLLLSQSPIVFALLVVVALAVLALALLRKSRPERRPFLQLAMLGAAALLGLIVWLGRGPLIAFFSASDELSYRVTIWGRLLNLIRFHSLEGWGWIGRWLPDLQPFPTFQVAGEREPTSAANAYLDLWFQTGIVGLFVFLVLVTLAFTRSWLLAGRHRTVVFAWPALVLLVLLLSSLAESSILVEYGWLTFVVCAVKAAQQLSWRRAFTPKLEQEPL